MTNHETETKQFTQEEFRKVLRNQISFTNIEQSRFSLAKVQGKERSTYHLLYDGEKLCVVSAPLCHRTFGIRKRMEYKNGKFTNKWTGKWDVTCILLDSIEKPKKDVDTWELQKEYVQFWENTRKTAFNLLKDVGEIDEDTPMKFVFPSPVTRPKIKGTKKEDPNKSPLIKIQCYYNTPKEQSKEDYDAFVDRKLAEVFEDITNNPMSASDLELKTSGKDAKFVMKLMSCVNIGAINLVNDKYYLAKHLGTSACKLVKRQSSRQTVDKKHLSKVNWGNEESATIDPYDDTQE